MTDDRDPEATLDEWKASMQADHEAEIHNPDLNDDHRIESVVQASVRIGFRYEDGDLVETERERVDPPEPELFSCVCGVRGMTREEAVAHIAATQ
ncbi:hypothetical protein DM867_04865 [Halosegnis rubeus]|jgi:hypothetical protein|uniref:Uncharacterized protein n=1 Tax=Halosegnis rubeus TaxID=2212850 RepID=A0A5N5UA73_9EURY|nr:hypothetical protein [Halosegnis rubeus]KAB7515398.1 hypothetical protein DMP03_09250 [Halosegnis rubeus]KAB7516450.1 hypothetical protein DM867_04865 [Halosegnis rubeus]KAB7517561.1 hypothetical protein DP108_08255 [Halosegnis rubeus]